MPFFASIFEKACSKGYLDVVRYCLPFCKGVVSLNLGVFSALRGGHLRVAEYIHRGGSSCLSCQWLFDACRGRNHRCIDWVMEMVGQDIKHYLAEYSLQLDILSSTFGDEILWNKLFPLCATVKKITTKRI